MPIMLPLRGLARDLSHGCNIQFSGGSEIPLCALTKAFSRPVAISATVVHMARAVSIRELRNSTAAVVSELEAGERLTLTVNRRPVADILPHVEDRDPWVPATELRRIVSEAPTDPGLLDDLAEIRGAELDDDA
jgi:antitoxin (DNA-binding transcriptional repressor) of toxin-antitoxin stability system